MNSSRMRSYMPNHKTSSAQVLSSLVIAVMLTWPAFVSMGWATQQIPQRLTPLAQAAQEYPLLKKAPPLDLDQLLVKPQVLQVTLSPDGSGVAYASREQSGYSVWLLDTTSQHSQELFLSRIIRSIEWSTDGNTLLMPTASGVGYADVKTGKRGLFVRFDEHLGDKFVGVDRSHACHVLLQRKVKIPGRNPSHQLVRVGLDGRQEIIFQDGDAVYDFLLGPDGSVRFIRQAVGKQHVIFELAEDSKREVFRTSALDMCSLLEFDELNNCLVLAGYGDKEFRCLQSLDLETGTLRNLHTDPESNSDLDKALTCQATGRLLIASYYGDRRRNYGVAPEMRDDVSWLEASFFNSIEIEARNKGAWLIRERAAGIGHDRYFLFENGAAGGKRRLVPILNEQRQRRWPMLESDLSPMIPVHYSASDGMHLSGYVSLPKGVPLDSAPFITNIHGGPFSRVKDLQSELQYLNNLGYIVFSPNFRSSSGYGLSFMKSGYGQFSTRVQRDIVEGIEHLLSQGIGNRNKVGAMGHSFGGYSVLSLLATYPEMFSAGVATASPTDIIDTLFRIEQADINRYDGVPIIDVMPLLVADPSDDLMLQRMHEKSPASNLERLNCPLLVWAGAKDVRVPVTHITDYAVKAAQYGKPIELIVDHATGHNFSSRDSNGSRSLTEITASFFAKHLLEKSQPLSRPSAEYRRRYSSNLKHAK